MRQQLDIQEHFRRGNATLILIVARHKIVSHGTAGNGPSYFTVQTKAGQTMEFGNTTGSKILAQGKTTVRVWALDKITDSKSNYLTVSYTNNTTTGEAYPIEIDYTGNTAAGIAPFNSVQFVYNTSRLYTLPAYQAGSLVETTVLLTDVKTYTGLASGGSATLVSDYRLGYTPPASAAAHYELTSITQCDASSGGHCLQPTTFGWQGSKDSLSLNGTANSLSQGTPIAAGYFQGSGLTDAIVPGLGSNCGLYFATPTGFVLSSVKMNYEQWTHDPETGWSSAPYTGPVCKTSGVKGGKRYVDLNADGLTDLLLIQNVSDTQAENFPLLNSGSALTQPTNGEGQYIGASYPTAFNTGDFNGDGRTDTLIWLGGTTYQETFGDGLGNFNGGPQFNWTNDTLAVGDFDGDGCSDVMEEQASSPQVLLSCNPAVPSFSVPNFAATSEVVLGDFNGDGLTDILVAPQSGAATLYLSIGTGLASPITLSGFTDWGKYAIYVGDWNGDGKDDILLIAPGQTGYYGVGTSHKVFLSVGTNFLAGPTISNNTSGDVFLTATVADWNNDGASDFWLQKPSGDVEELFSYVPEAIKTITNGLGITTTVTYNAINNNSPLYQKCTTSGTYVCGTAYPIQSLDGPLYVVSQISSSNGVGGNYASTYAYQAAQSDLSGYGFLGFNQVIVTDPQTGVVQTTTYDQAFPLTGLIASQTKVSGSITVSAKTNTYGVVGLGSGTDGVARYFVELQKSVVVSNDLDGSAMPTVTTTYTYDCDTGSACAGTSPTGYGNAPKIVTSLSDGSTKTVTNTYLNDTSNGHWYLGRLTTATAKNVVGASNLTRQTSYTYDTGAAGSTGLLTSEIVEPESSPDPSLILETDYYYDAFGNKNRTVLKGCVWNPDCSVTQARETDTTYDTSTYNGQFLTTTQNALNQSETWSYAGNIAFGGPTSHTGPNGLTTTWQYDTFGRKILEVRPDGNQTLIGYVYCTTTTCPVLPVGQTLAQLPANVQFYVLSTPETAAGAQNGPITVTYYDGLSRAIATDVEGFDASGTGCTLSAPCWIRSATVFAPYGRVNETSRPYFLSGGTPQWTVYTYDVLGRVTVATLPDTTTVVTHYCGLSTSVKNQDGQIKTTVDNAEGLVATVYESATAACDTSGSPTNYAYDAFSDLLTVVDTAGNTVANNTYDIRGRKIGSIDADMGSWTYQYSAFGELDTQTDAKSQITSLVYDKLSRLIRRNETGLNSVYTYDTAPGMGVGQIASATTGANYTRAYAYDSLGRPSTVTLTEDGAANVYTYAYDANGRVQSLAYPSGFTAQYTYTSLGYLHWIADAATGKKPWSVTSRDAELHALTEAHGNGMTITQAFDPETGRVQSILAGTGNAISDQTFTFDALGNLTSRTWLNNAGAVVQENSCYDNLNRLIHTLITTGTACTGAGAVTMTYDALGDITKKSDVCSAANCFVYGGSGAGPHALTSIVGTYNGVVNPTFTYDANGFMTAGAGRTVTATSFDMAATITDGSNTAAFTYDTEHARYKMVTTGVTAATTYYLNDPVSGAMEEEVVAGGTTTWNDYLKADGKLVAEGTCVGAAPCAAGDSFVHFVLDHLGSVAVIVNSAGTVLNRLNYDAWGKRRNADGTAIDCTAGAAPPSSVTRGFTGHEMLDGVCLINMNARAYDPSLGRFMSADSMVGDETIPQALNRFTYVLNNPLSLTDPSGHGFWSIFRDIAALVVVFVFQHYELLPQIGAALGFYASPFVAEAVNAGIIGGIGGLISTGSLKGAALDALQGGLFNIAGDFLQSGGVLGGSSGFLGIGHQATVFIAHGLVGGLVTEIGGGRFSSGFLAAGISSFTPAPVNNETWEEAADGTIVAAGLGGVGSLIGGGKFANGAITGAFGYLLNECAHAKCWVGAKDEAFLDTGDNLGFYKSMCQGGDTYYSCQAYHIAAGDNGPGRLATDWLITSINTNSLLPTDEFLEEIRSDLARAYANYLGYSPDTAKVPSATDIERFHWRVFGNLGLPSWTFGGSFLGAWAPGVPWFTSLYCVKCRP